MKNWIKNIFNVLGILSLLVVLASCVEDDDAPVGGAAPPFGDLSNDLSGSEFVLLQENEDEDFITLSWADVDFSVSKPVKYTIEIGFAGGEFARATGVATEEDISSYTVSVSELNAAMINLGVEPEETADIEIRVRAWVDFLTDPSLSDPIRFTATPYLLTFPPIYIVGDAQSWTLENAAELQSFSPNIYEGVARFQTNGNFRFFKIPDWEAEQWGFSAFSSGSVPAEFANAGDGDSNFKFTGLTAEYRITVDFNSLTIALEPLGPPPPPAEIFLIDPATVDFDLTPALAAVSEGALEYEAVVMLEENKKFRLFDDRSWNAGKWDWTFFEGGNVDNRLTASGDDQSNILFTGEAGWYTINVSIEDASITLTETAEPSQSLFLVGDGHVSNWDLETSLSFNSLGDNKFEAVGTFQAGKFRFLPEKDWTVQAYGYSFFADGSVDGNLADSGDGDSNFEFTGDPGVYKMTVSLAEKTIVMEPVEAPTLHIMGDDQDWTDANATPLTWMEGGLFEGTADFTTGSIFRFFANNDPDAWDWGGEQWRYSSFTEGTIDPDLADGGGADSNFLFEGTTGTYTVRVDLYNLVVELE